MQRQILTKDRTVFIHDFDGVHYDYADHPDIYEFLGNVKAHVTELLLPFLGRDEAKQLGMRSYKETGDGLLYFLDLARARGMDAEEMRRDIHIGYHRVGREWMMEQQPQIFAPCRHVNESLDSLKGAVRHGLLTQSCIENWARPLLKNLHRLDYFEPHALIGFAEVSYVTKASSTEPLRYAMDVMDAVPQNTAFLEDSLPNLKMAKQLDPEILTVYFSHGQPLETLPDFVDMQTANMRTFSAEARAIFNPAPRFAVQQPTPQRAFTL